MVVDLAKGRTSESRRLKKRQDAGAASNKNATNCPGEQGMQTELKRVLSGRKILLYGDSIAEELGNLYFKQHGIEYEFARHDIMRGSTPEEIWKQVSTQARELTAQTVEKLNRAGVCIISTGKNIMKHTSADGVANAVQTNALLPMLRAKPSDLPMLYVTPLKRPDGKLEQSRIREADEIGELLANEESHSFKLIRRNEVRLDASDFRVGDALHLNHRGNEKLARTILTKLRTMLPCAQPSPSSDEPSAPNGNDALTGDSTEGYRSSLAVAVRGTAAALPPVAREAVAGAPEPTVPTQVAFSPGDAVLAGGWDARVIEVDAASQVAIVKFSTGGPCSRQPLARIVPIPPLMTARGRRPGSTKRQRLTTDATASAPVDDSASVDSNADAMSGAAAAMSCSGRAATGAATTDAIASAGVPDADSATQVAINQAVGGEVVGAAAAAQERAEAAVLLRPCTGLEAPRKNLTRRIAEANDEVERARREAALKREAVSHYEGVLATGPQTEVTAAAAHRAAVVEAEAARAETVAAEAAYKEADAARKAANQAFEAAKAAYKEAQRKMERQGLTEQKRREALEQVQRESLARQDELRRRKRESTEADAFEQAAKQRARKLEEIATARERAEELKAKAANLVWAAAQAKREADEAVEAAAAMDDDDKEEELE